MRTAALPWAVLGSLLTCGRDAREALAGTAPRPSVPAVAATAPPPPVAVAPAATTALDAATARDVLWPVAADQPPAAAACATAGSPIACLLALRWESDPAARDRALGLYRDTGTVTGVARAFVMDGGYRGDVRIEPALPLGRWAHHQAWADAALREQDRFYTALAAEAGVPLAYRWRDLELRFFRSVNRHTPAAFAQYWAVSYNVEGGINDGAPRVRDTLFHEVFHLNDAAHGDWSLRVLGPLHARIVARCGARTACLAPYAPNTLRVRNGTFYAFQPGNDVREYAAELAVRYYHEATGPHPGPPFACGAPENAVAWEALAREFFAGLHARPGCGP